MEEQMKIVETIQDLRSHLKLERVQGNLIGFVPTMGYLHNGHAALMQEARQANDVGVLSIFVNPTQFGPNEDYHTYPRDLERDTEIARANHVDYIFYPTVEEMYSTANSSVSVTVHHGTDILCGKSRPTHFDGVATVVTKLLNIIQPDRVYFGMKDAQQLAIVKQLVRDLSIPVEVCAVEIVRESDNLALSSRNVRLNAQERIDAICLYQTLSHVRSLLDQGYEVEQAILFGREFFNKISKLGQLDYLEAYAFPGLTQLQSEDKQGLLAIAVQYENARLIDNMIIDF